MPWVACEFSLSSGFEDMLVFIKRNSGASIYLPADPNSFSGRFGIEVPEPDYRLLLDRVDSKGSISVPSAWGVFLAIRRAAVRIAIERGEPDRIIARRFGASLRYVKQERSLCRLPPGDPAAA